MSQTRIEFNTSRHAEPPVREGWYRCGLLRAERDINSNGARDGVDAALFVDRGSMPRGTGTSPRTDPGPLMGVSAEAMPTSEPADEPTAVGTARDAPHGIVSAGTRPGSVVCRPGNGVPDRKGLLGALDVTTVEQPSRCRRAYPHPLDVRGGFTPAPLRRTPVGDERPDRDCLRRGERAGLARVREVTGRTVTSPLDEARLPDDAPGVHIDTLRAGTEVGVRDSAGRSVPTGAAGGAHLCGPLPSRGCLGGPELTGRRMPEPPRRRAGVFLCAADRARAGGRRRLPPLRWPVGPCDAFGHRTPRRCPRDRRSAGHDRLRSSDTPPARPLAFRGADPPRPVSAPFPPASRKD